ncbi:hypothetical protein NVP1261O_09 [Vibrio phage 1.261.O._10N.286.51.A7]|uniref:Uncharacterized protein n=2 Tax=Mukerjeevirus TaxID=2733146 RepID=A0A2I7RRX6_9CAUD|nr:hypothetical protein HOU79_gp08 [Vibrio phage 1.224.A._10N.261.48.B1]YP_009817694.1 hypothetical protein HOU80_gp09 [Vibrio phage 1.261.O._10N.286.51.A7]AUR96375.1 hypothetical protein NVP1224A_08 [Vibrio phage 1.224.A._10N.261.48.B1]AUR99013.1 hypothetical protein NVP1261O_09 [Vibrio phage 1.261.O._10N.286.51.A7]
MDTFTLVTLLTDILRTLTTSGEQITLSHDNQRDVLCYDLNVGLKSHIHLMCYDKKLMAHMRYGDACEITQLSDLLAIYDKWFEDAKTRGWGAIILPDGWEQLYIQADIPPPQSGTQYDATRKHLFKKD